MKHRLIALFVSLFLLAANFASAQTDTSFLNKAISALVVRATDRPDEKVYLHLNKPVYDAGDTIWFKAYAIVGDHHQLSALSGVLHVELIDPQDSVKGHMNLRLTEGITWGEFPLSKNIKGGRYRLRAYTNWMRNNTYAGLSEQPVDIALQLDAPDFSQNNAKTKPDVQFFPEGGDLVSGLRNRVAIKSINTNGLGQDVKGSIVDDAGKDVASFETTHLGMGAFALTPEAGKKYQAKITTADGSDYTYNLPEVKAVGFAINVNNSRADSIYLRIAASDQLFKAKQHGHFYIVAQVLGKSYYTTSFNLDAASFATTIDKSRFPSGVVQFTLFSAEGEPLNERLAFVSNVDTLRLKVKPGNTSSSQRQKMDIGIEAADGTGKGVQGSFSVSVINLSQVAFNPADENTIMTSLLLTSDLKGYIEQPNYYFLNQNENTAADLDLVMLTHGYRRFEWKQALSSGEPKLAFQPEESINLEGTIKSTAGQPIPNAKVRLVATKDNLVLDTIANLNGNFRFNNLNIGDRNKVVISGAKSSDSKKVTIYIKQPDHPAVLKSNFPNPNTFTNIPPDVAAQMQKNYLDYQKSFVADSGKNGVKLKDVNINAVKKRKPDYYNSYGTVPEKMLDMTKLRGFNDLMQAVTSAAGGGLTLQNGRLNYFRDRVVVNIDGLDYNNYDLLYSLTPQDVASIDFISPGGLNRSGGHKPAFLMITTNKRNGTDTTVLKTVTIKASSTPKKPEIQNSSNLHGGGNADQVIMMDNLYNCAFLSDCLQGRIMGVTIKNGTPYNNRSRSLGSPNGVKMSIIVDGNVMDGSELVNISGIEVYSVEVLRSVASTSIYGTSIEAGGALIITTKRGGEPNDSYITSIKPQGIITYPFDGFRKARVFYSPQYNAPKRRNDQPDLRSAVYWKPDMVTDNDGKASFSYFNTDAKGSYRVVVEGIDDVGNIGRSTFIYEVK